MKRTAVCVLGMSRSGTSLAIRTLNLLGAELGPEESLIPANAHNERGYWEQRPIFELNEAILAALGGDYEHPPLCADGWEHWRRLTLLRQRAQRALKDLFGDARCFGFKDPRLCFTFPFWRSLIPELRCAICVRDPARVAASYRRFAGDEDAAAERGLALWILSTACALRSTVSQPRTMVFYDDFFDDLPGQVRRLAALLDHEPTDDEFAAVESFVDPGLRRASGSDESPRASEAAEIAATLYTALRRSAVNARADVVVYPELEKAAEASLAAMETSFARTRRRAPATKQPLSITSDLPRELAGADAFGIHSDGWLDPDVYCVMGAGGAGYLVVRADVLDLAGQRLDVIVDGAVLASRPAMPGLLSVRLPVPPSDSPRLVELRWAKGRRLDASDGRHVAARLRSLRLLSAPT
jgi:hypothetical protein